MSLIFLDIETIPCNDNKVIEQLQDAITPPGNITKDETKLKWLEQNLEAELDKAVRKTALDGLYGQILSISWAIDDSEIYSVFRSSYDDSEARLLDDFFYGLDNYHDHNGQRVGISKWVGHFLTGFDLRFIWQRCVINRVKPTIAIPYDAKPWDDRVFDTKIAWTGNGQYSGSGSLDKLSLVLLGEGKGDINGANVYDYFIEGAIDKIVEYNKKDVEMCRNLYKRMNFL